VIEGAITNPGSYVREEGLTVDGAIAHAGGITDRGSARGIMIRRVVNGETKMVTVTLEARVLPDDIIIIRVAVF
jgi:protein involved in polysaccharide export with SLBB domain